MPISIPELIVVILVGLFLLKPKDIPIIITKLKSFYAYFLGIKKEILTSFDESTINDIEHNHDKINYYLNKIIQINGKYDGEYSLAAVKEKYRELISQQINNTELEKSKD